MRGIRCREATYPQEKYDVVLEYSCAGHLHSWQILVQGIQLIPFGLCPHLMPIEFRSMDYSPLKLLIQDYLFQNHAEKSELLEVDNF